MPTIAEHERVREFLQGTQAKRSVRSIFNSKINRVTNKSGLTAITTHVGEETVTVLGPGQLFGEGRFLKIYERIQKEQMKSGVAGQVDKRADKKMPLEFEDDESSKAPYSVKCSSMTGEVWRIKGSDFYRLILRDKTTSQILGLNINERIIAAKRNDNNRHDEFKFHNIQGKEIDSLLDSGSDRYVSDDENEMKEQQKNEKLVLKDILVAPGTDFREQLHEMVNGFPKVKRAMNLEESVSDWNDSEGNTGSILDHDEAAFAKTEKTILNSFQAYARKKHGEPNPNKHISKLIPVNKAVQIVNEMATSQFGEALKKQGTGIKDRENDAVTKLNDVKGYVRNSFKGDGPNEPTSHVPSIA